MSCFVDTETPIRWKKLTTWWPDCSHDINCHSSENWLQEMETNQHWNWRLSVLKTIKMMLVRPLKTSFKTRVRTDCAVSGCSPLPQPINALTYWLTVKGGVSLCIEPPAPFSFAAIQDKADFSFLQPHLSIGFCVTSSWTPLWVTVVK